MRSDRFAYPGIAGAVAGVIGLYGVYAGWFELAGPGGALRVEGTADASGKLALAMSLSLFAFSAAYILLGDPRVRRAMASLMTVSAVVLTLACVWGVARADGSAISTGLWLSGLAGVLGIGAGILTMRDAPVGADIADDVEAPAAAS
jgi:hypothetical protein